MTPGPTNVPPRIMRAMIKPMIHHRGPEFQELYKSILDNAKYLFQTKYDVVVISSSGTGGIECAVSNIIQGVKKIIVPVGGIFGQRLSKTISVMGGKPIEIPVDWKRAVTIDMIEDAIKKEKDAKAVAVIYNETSTGAKIKCMREIGELCNERDLLFIVDAISILGGDHLPVDDWYIDICIAGSQKCLMTPPGLSLLSISDNAWSFIEKAENSFYFNLKSCRKYKEKCQTPFTPAIPLYYALDEALKIIIEERLENVISRHKVCAKASYSAIGKMGLTPFPEKEFRSNTVLAINNPPKVNDTTLRELLRKKYNIVIAGGQGKLKGSIFRIGMMGKIGPPEVLQTISSLNMALSELGLDLKFDDSLSVAREILQKRLYYQYFLI